MYVCPPIFHEGSFLFTYIFFLTDYEPSLHFTRSVFHPHTLCNRMYALCSLGLQYTHVPTAVSCIKVSLMTLLTPLPTVRPICMRPIT